MVSCDRGVGYFRSSMPSIPVTFDLVSIVYFCNCTVKEIIGDSNDYTLVDVPLMFGSTASPTVCVVDEELCFTFEADQDTIKEEEEKFKIYLSTSDTGIKLCNDQGHVTILEDPADGMKLCLSNTYCLMLLFNSLCSCGSVPLSDGCWCSE